MLLFCDEKQELNGTFFLLKYRTIIYAGTIQLYTNCRRRP